MLTSKTVFWNSNTRTAGCLPGWIASHYSVCVRVAVAFTLSGGFVLRADASVLAGVY